MCTDGERRRARTPTQHGRRNTQLPVKHSGQNLLVVFSLRFGFVLSPVFVSLDEGEVGQQAVVRAAPDREGIVSAVGVENIERAAKADGLRGAEAQLHADALRSRAELQTPPHASQHPIVAGLWRLLPSCMSRCSNKSRKGALG